MAKKTWFAGTVMQEPADALASLTSLIGTLAEQFDWTGEVELEDGRTLSTFRRRGTGATLYLDADGQAWQKDYGTKVRFCETSMHSALYSAFGCWHSGHGYSGWESDDFPVDRADRREDSGSERQQALIAAALGHAGRVAPPSGFTAAAGPDASVVHVETTLLDRARRYVPDRALATDDTVVEHALAMYAVDRELIDPSEDHHWGLRREDQRRLHDEDVHRAQRGPTGRPGHLMPF